MHEHGYKLYELLLFNRLFLDPCNKMFSFWSTSLINFWESLKTFIIIIAKSTIYFFAEYVILKRLVHNDEKRLGLGFTTHSQEWKLNWLLIVVWILILIV